MRSGRSSASPTNCSPHRALPGDDDDFENALNSPKANEKVGSSARFEDARLFALVTLVPLVWLLSVTITAGVQKICHSDPRIGFLSRSKCLQRENCLRFETAVATAQTRRNDADAIEATPRRPSATIALCIFNNMLDASWPASFLALVVLIVLLSVREWILLCARAELADVARDAARLAAGLCGRRRQAAAYRRARRARLRAGEGTFRRSRTSNGRSDSLASCDACAHETHGKSAESVYVEAREQRSDGVEVAARCNTAYSRIESLIAEMNRIGLIRRFVRSRSSRPSARGAGGASKNLRSNAFSSFPAAQSPFKPDSKPAPADLRGFGCCGSPSPDRRATKLTTRKSGAAEFPTRSTPCAITAAAFPKPNCFISSAPTMCRSCHKWREADELAAAR